MRRHAAAAMLAGTVCALVFFAPAYASAAGTRLGPLHAHPAHVGERGGAVKLTAHTAGTKTCRVSVKPRISHTPRKVRCVELLRTKLRLPANTLPFEQDFTVTVRAGHASRRIVLREGPNTAPAATRIAGEGYFDCAIAISSGVWCWGLGSSGQLGPEAVGATPRAVRIPEISGATSVAAGFQHACAVSYGSAWCWGSNYYGELGNGSSGEHSHPSPVKVPLANVVQVAANEEVSCALVTGGSVYCWGGNQSGDLGNGKAANEVATAPQLVLTHATQIAAHAGEVCAIVQRGAVDCWGADEYGQIGNGKTSETPVTSPTPVLGIRGATRITAGEWFTCVLLANRRSECWGQNEDGELGNGASGPKLLSPMPVPAKNAAGAIELSAGGFVTCSRNKMSRAHCWGDNASGELGTGFVSEHSSPAVTTPTEPVGLGPVREIAAGGFNTCALTPEGTAYCWGGDSFGEVGNEEVTGTPVLKPTPVAHFP